ncbi:MAG: hypothetical protein JWO06_2841 [Bacteroidota bacterium]|nr:hypothetical protein [Bacteroidota bacterium]
MKSILLFFAFLITAALLPGTTYGNTISAGFTYQSGCNGSVTFAASQQGYTSYTWYFGDNTTGTGANVIHQYTQGTYNVTLFVQNSGDTGVQTIPIYVGEFIQQQITGPADVCSGTVADYTLTNPSANLQYNWLVSGADMFGNAHSDHVQLSFTTAGAAVLSVIVSNGAGCDSVLKQNIAVHQTPKLIMPGQANDSSQVTLVICQNSPVWYHVLTNTPGTITWSSGNGIMLSPQGVDSMLFSFPTAGSTTIQVAEVTPWGCTDTVTAQITVTANPIITATASDACLGSDNNFIATPNPLGTPLTYQWLFDDGTQASGMSASHTFSTAGGHSGRVIAVDQNGCVDTASTSVLVDVTPGPPIVCVGPVCAGAQEVYSTTAVAGVSYHWAITGGTITAGGGLSDNTIAVTWGSGAMGTISLFLTGPGTYCQVATTENVPLVGGALAIQGPTTPCVYNNVTYTTDIIPGGIYTWTTTTGSISSGQGTNQIQMNFYSITPGTVSVTVNHQILTCSSNASLPVTPLNPFSVYGPAIACAGSPTTFSTYAAGSFNWTVTGGTIVSGNGTNQVQILWNNAGNYTVKATIATGYCNTESDMNVSVVPRKLEVVQGNNKTCAGSTETYFISPDESSWIWSVSGGGTILGSSNSNAVSILWNTAGTYTLQVIYANTNGCADTAYYTVNVAPQDVPIINGDTVVCFGSVSSFSFTPVSGVDYVWETQGGVITAGQGTSTVTVLWTGTQAGLLRLRNTACNTFRQLNVVIRPTPVIDFQLKNLTCDGSSVDLKVVQDYPTYNWSTTASTQTLHVTTAGVYIVTVTDSKGCTASASENANPIPNNGFVSSGIQVFAPSPPYPYPYLILTAYGFPSATSYVWNTGNHEDTQYASVAGTYTVTMTSDFGCTAVQSVTVTIVNGTCNGGGGSCGGGGTVLPCPGVYPVFTTNGVCNPVQFTPGVTATYYLWDFGDGVYSTSSNPSHRFATAGSKNIILTYSNDGLTWYQCNQTFVITSVMNIDFTSSGGCQGSTTLTNISTTSLPVSSVLWDFGDATTSAVTPVVNHQYPNTASSFAVTLTINDGVCTDFKQKQIGVSQLLANFVYADVCKDNPALFTDATTHSAIISSYSWNFGNGETADYYDPVTYFHTAANFNVSLTVKDANGCTDIKTQSVVVNQFGTLPVSASGPLTFCKGGSVNLSLPSGYIVYWNTGETTNSIHVTQSGKYFAWAKDAITGCSGFSDTVTVIVNIPPMAFINNPNGKTEICEGTLLNLNALPYSGVTYEWYLNNALLGNNGSYLYYWSVSTSQTGDYEVVITDANGCKDTTAIVHILVDPAPAYPNITQFPSGSVCSGQPVVLSVSGTDLYQWSNGSMGNTTTVYQSAYVQVIATNSFGCTSSSYSGVSFNPSPDFTFFPKGCYQICQSSHVIVSGPAGMQTYHWSDGETTQSIVLNASGTYSLSATGTDGCSGQSGSFDIDVFGSANLNLGNDTTICAGQTLVLDAGVYPTILWQDNSTAQTYTVVDSGLYHVQVTNSQGCITADTIHVNVDSASVHLGNDTAICNNQTLLLSVTGSFTSTVWQDGSTGSTYTVTQTGLYFVNVTDAYGCKGADSINVISTADAVHLGSDTTVCLGNTVLLSIGTNPGSPVWQDGSTNPTYVVSQSGLYYVDVTEASGCVAIDSIVVVVDSAIVKLGNDTSLCNGSNLLLSINSNFVNYVWQDGSMASAFTVSQAGLYYVNVTDSFGCTASDSIQVAYYAATQVHLGAKEYLCQPTIMLGAIGQYNTYAWSTGATTDSASISALGVYYLTVTDANGCSSSDSTNVLSCDTNECGSHYFIPNVFTPNHDGHNDEFSLMRRPNTVPSVYFQMTIYDRIGELVFQTNNENEAWDGKFRGKDAPQGVFVYMLNYVCKEENISLKGGVTLLR